MLNLQSPLLAAELVGQPHQSELQETLKFFLGSSLTSLLLIRLSVVRRLELRFELLNRVLDDVENPPCEAKGSLIALIHIREEVEAED